jgi:hypothetical protein
VAVATDPARLARSLRGRCFLGKRFSGIKGYGDRW